MFTVLWEVIFSAISIALLYFFGVAIGWLIGAIEAAGAAIGLSLDIMAFLRGILELAQAVYAVNEIYDTLDKIIDETVIYADEDDAQRQARHAALVRWHGERVYLYGDVSTDDVARLWFAGRDLADLGLLRSVFQVTDELAAI